MGTLKSSKVLAGGKVLIKLDTEVIGFASSMQCNDNYNLVPVHVIGQIQPIEFVPTTATHTITMDTLVMRSDSLIRHNLEPMTVGSYGYLNGQNLGNVSGQSDSYKTIGSGTPNDNGVGYKYAQQIADSSSQAGGGRLSLLDGKVFDISVVDGATGKHIVEYIDCYCTGGTFTVGQNNVIGKTVNFVALDRRGQLDAGDDSNLRKTGGGDFVNTHGSVYYNE